MAFATSKRALSNPSFAFCPKAYREEGFPYSSFRYGIIASNAVPLNFVVAALSAYIILFSIRLTPLSPILTDIYVCPVFSSELTSIYVFHFLSDDKFSFFRFLSEFNKDLCFSRFILRKNERYPSEETDISVFLYLSALYHIIPTLSIGIKDKRKILYFFHVSFKEIGERNAFKIFVHAPFQLFPKGESWTRRGAGTGGRGQ